MPKFKFIYGGEQADWEEHLYHRTLFVKGGIVETDSELDIDALLRRGWEQLPDEEEDKPKAAAKKKAPAE